MRGKLSVGLLAALALSACGDESQTQSNQPKIKVRAQEQEQLHTLTAHEQYEPAEIGAETDENGVERKLSRGQKMRARLSKGYFSESGQIPKPTREEYREIESGHGHH